MQKLWSVILGGVCAASASAVAAPLRWENVFQLRPSTPAVHFKASYVDGAGRSHTIEEWRDGNKHVRRQTDQGAVTLYMMTGEMGLRYEIVDHAHKLRYGVSQANLYILGLLVDPDELVTGVSRPKIDFSLVASSRKAQTTAAGKCQWYRLEAPKHALIEEVCWSRDLGLALQIEMPDGNGRKTAFSVTELSLKPPASDFEVKERDFTYIDADRDLVSDD